MFWDQHLALEHLLERRNDSLVQRRPAQEHDPLSDVSIFHYPVQVIVDDCIAKPCDEILPLAPLLQIAPEVVFHEYCTPLCKIDRTVRAKGYFLEFPDNINLHLVGKLVQEAARAGRTDLIHIEIKRVGVFYH